MKTEVIKWNDFFHKPSHIVIDAEVLDKTPDNKLLEFLRPIIRGVRWGVIITFVSPLLVDGVLIIADSVIDVFQNLAGVETVFASTDVVEVTTAVAEPDSWTKLIHKIIWIVDKLMSGVIIFSGVLWMFGNRTKAIELLFGAGVGYIIVRHHEDIKNFFALI